MQCVCGGGVVSDHAIRQSCGAISPNMAVVARQINYLRKSLSAHPDDIVYNWGD